MKTILISLFMCVSCICVNAATPALILHPGDNPVEASCFDQGKLTVVIHFGVSTNRCVGFGLCYIDVFYSDNIVKQPDTGAGLAVLTPQGKLQIEFDPESMEESTLKKYFGSGIFIINEDYELPAEALKALDLKSYNVKAGRYPITTTDTGGLLVTF